MASQSLQAKVQLLVVLSVLFTLISVPLFSQVRDDAKHDKARANNTFIAKWIKDLFQDPPEDLEVEDAWGQYTREQGENCGPVCDPNGDYDGDNMTNRQEIDEGRNPACNEEANPPGYCEGEPPVPPPDNQTVQPLDEKIFHGNLTFGGTNTEAAQEFDAPLREPNYNRWTIVWQARNYHGADDAYTVAIYDADGDAVKTFSGSFGFLDEEDSGSGTINPAPGSGAQYRIAVEFESAPITGGWEIQIRGIRAGSQGT